MRRALSLTILVSVAICAGACRTEYKAEVRYGTSAPPSNPTVVLFPVPCVSSDNKCEPEYGKAVTAQVRSELEFAGYNVVDGEKLVADPRYRDQREGEVTSGGQPVVEGKSLRRVGSIFEDLPPGQQRALLADAKANGAVTGTIHMLPKGTTKNWLVEVSFKFSDVEGQLVWVARCKHESYWNERNSWSIEQAAGCAIKGALARH